MRESDTAAAADDLIVAIESFVERIDDATERSETAAEEAEEAVEEVTEEVEETEETGEETEWGTSLAPIQSSLDLLIQVQTTIAETLAAMDTRITSMELTLSTSQTPIAEPITEPEILTIEPETMELPESEGAALLVEETEPGPLTAKQAQYRKIKRI